MCQCQLSSPSLPSEAATPPCAATVCERVGKTFDSTATFRLASARWSAARRPDPPAPTTTASNCLFAIAIYLYAPQNLHRPARVRDQRGDHQGVQREPHAAVLDVIHEYVAHADPCVEIQAQQTQQRCELHPLRREEPAPCVMIDDRRCKQQPDDEQRVKQHDDRGHALREPIAQPVVRAGHRTVHHMRTPISKVSTMLTASTSQLENRADFNSVPRSMSDARWRTPAHR